MVDQGVLELLIGNEKVTDRQTDRQTDRHVQSNMPFLLWRGGIKKRPLQCSQRKTFI